jgi:hypothetical protein
LGRVQARHDGRTGDGDGGRRSCSRTRSAPRWTPRFEAGLSVTALHNHFFFDEPKVYFMHIGGEGTAEKLAAGVRRGARPGEAGALGQPQPGTFLRQDRCRKRVRWAAPAIGADPEAKPAEKDGMVKMHHRSVP